MSTTKPKIEMRPLADVIPYEMNVKKHGPDQVKKIAESIRRFGWDQPIVVDKFGVIIKGHGRHAAATLLGLEQVPVWVRADLTPDEVKASRLADNRVAISDIDNEMLQAELASIEMGLDGIFDDKELEFLEADLGAMDDGAFVDDMDRVVAEQKAEIGAKSDAAAGARVPLSKAFGFKNIPGAAQIAITNMMAKAVAATGLAGEAALVAWAASL